MKFKNELMEYKGIKFKMSKRILTDDEIQDIINQLKIIGPKHFKSSIHDNIIKKLKQQLIRVELYPDMYEIFKQNIIEQYYKSHVSPGENVGILTAQSIGEKQTQMSLAYDESVYVKYNGYLKNVRIGKFIEDMMTQQVEKVIRISEHSWILNTSKDELYTSSIDNKGFPSWSRITCLSKHFPNGNLVEVKTKSGKKVTCTYSHSLLTHDKTSDQVIPIKASNVVLGTVLPILNNYTSLFKFGKKTLPHNTAKIYGLFKKYGKIVDNNIHFDYKYQEYCDLLYNYAQCNMIDFTINSTTVIYYNMTIPDLDCSLYVLYNGSQQDIIDYIDILRQDGRNKISRQAMDCIYGENVKLLMHIFDKPSPNSIYWDPIISLKNVNEYEYLSMYNYVYDFSVDINETFMLTNGMFVHNTLNSIIGSELIQYNDIKTGANYITTIGEFVDSHMEKYKDSIEFVSKNNTEYLKLSENIRILSTNKKGRVEWSKVTAITRHDIQPGDLIKVYTELGRIVTATKYKSFFTRFDNKLIQKMGTSLKIGDIFPIVQKSPFIDGSNKVWQGYELNYDLGFLIAMYIIHGHTNEHRTIITTRTLKKQQLIINFATQYAYKYIKYFNGIYIFSRHLYCALLELKELPSFLLTASYECLRGFMYGLFYNHDTCIITDYKCKLFISEIASRFGIVCKITDHQIQIVNYTDYVSIIINNKIIMNYTLYDKIPGVTTFILNGTFLRHHLRDIKSSNLTDKYIIQDTVNQTVYYDKVVNIEPVFKPCKVYDLTVDNKTFSLLGGALVYDTFHTAGLTVKTVVSGVPRFMELMNTTKEPKSASCFIKVPVSDTIKGINDIRNYIGDKLRCLQLTRILYNYTIVSYKDIKNDWWIMDEHVPIELVDEDKILRLQLSHKLIYEYRCSLTSIINKINSVFTDIYTVCSSLNECIIDVFILNKSGIILDKQVCYVTDENKYEIFLEEIVLTKLDKFIISGIEKINDYMVSTIKPGHEWMILTEGSNLKGLMELNLFDFHNVMSNNMWEIYNLLGIEAAREFLIREFTDVISSDGTFINKCHILLLVDTMTCKGDITSISRYSLRSKSSVLSRSSFEESIENFLKSGIFSEIDKMTSISSNIMTGKLSHVGTGICDVILSDQVFEKQDIYPSESINIYDVKNKMEICEKNILNVLPTIFE